MPYGAFPWETVLTQMPHNYVKCRVIFGMGVMTTGSGPCDEGGFDEFLQNCGVDVFYVSEFGPSKLIIGHKDWEEDKIHLAIKARAGGSLWVYSQEMVFASLAIGSDVFEVCSRDELASFGDGHPALEYLMEDMGFNWPTTDIFPSSNRLTDDLGYSKWPEVSVLRHMGYKVGKRGLGKTARHKILDRALEIELVSGAYGSKGNIEEWGTSLSPQRLQKIANFLASFARLKKRSTTYDYSQSIADYESDLGYLKSTYYRSDLGFHWPDTDVYSR